MSVKIILRKKMVTLGVLPKNAHTPNNYDMILGTDFESRVYCNAITRCQVGAAKVENVPLNKSTLRSDDKMEASTLNV